MGPSAYMLPSDLRQTIEIEELTPLCLEVWFIPEDNQLRLADINSQDRDKYRVRLLVVSAKHNSISIYPVSTRPNSSRFLKPKYDKVREITLAETDLWRSGPSSELPKTKDDILEILLELPSGFIKNPIYGLGLAKDYRFIIDAVEKLSSCTSIVITPNEKTHADEAASIFFISSADFDQMRLKINAITRASQMAGRSVKETTIHNYLAEKIGEPLVEITAGRSPVRRMITAEVIGKKVSPIEAQEAALHALRKSAKSLKPEETERLALMRSGLELVNLDALIERFGLMLPRKIGEAKWQAFFNTNPFVLEMAFGYPVIKVRDQASVGGRRLSGDGEKITDFLVKNSLTNNTAVFEIKNPRMQLLHKRPYRQGVYTPSADLSGAINQALDQKYQLQKQIAQTKENTRLYDIESYAVHCCLVIGTTPDGADQKKSFELFRQNSKDVEVITFDELLEKLKQLATFLRSADGGKN